MTAPAVIECKKHTMRQTSEGSWLVTLSLHQADVPHWLFTAPVGQRMALAELTILADEQEPPADDSPQAAGGHARAAVLSPERRSKIASEAAKTRWEPAKRKPLSPGSRAALMCKDPRAWPVIAAAVRRRDGIVDAPIPTEAEATWWLRHLCNVASRADITADNQAWRTLEADYERAIGKIGP